MLPWCSFKIRTRATTQRANLEIVQTSVVIVTFLAFFGCRDKSGVTDVNIASAADSTKII